MPGTVSEVSATLVAMTMRRPPLRLKTRCCCSADKRANNGRISTVRAYGRRAMLFASRSDVSRISRSPGRNTRTSPGPSRQRSSAAAERAITHFDRIVAARYLEHRRRLAIDAEMAGEALGVQRRRSHDQLQI